MIGAEDIIDWRRFLNGWKEKTKKGKKRKKKTK